MHRSGRAALHSGLVWEASIAHRRCRAQIKSTTRAQSTPNANATSRLLIWSWSGI
jgi:hypothetical protein